MLLCPFSFFHCHLGTGNHVSLLAKVLPAMPFCHIIESIFYHFSKMFHDVPRFPGGGVQPVQACHQLGAGRHPRRLGQPSSGDPNLGGALGSDPNPGPSRFYLYFWEKIFYIFRYILYIHMGDSKIFSPHHGQNQWLLIGCFSIRPGRQPAATRDGCSALRAAQVLGRFGSFQRAIGFHVHPGEGRMVKDGEGW